GFGFAIWDWMFGTLYPVDRREPIRIGMNGQEEAEYHSVKAMYLLPFVKAWRRLKGKADPARPGPTTAWRISPRASDQGLAGPVAIGLPAVDAHSVQEPS